MKWNGETGGRLEYNEIGVKGSLVLKTSLFAMVHVILRAGISIDFVYLKWLSYVFWWQQQIQSIVSCPVSPQTSWGLEEIKVLSFQAIKSIQYQPPTQKFPRVFQYEKNNAKAFLFDINW